MAFASLSTFMRGVFPSMRLITGVSGPTGRYSRYISMRGILPALRTSVILICALLLDSYPAADLVHHIQAGDRVQSFLQTGFSCLVGNPHDLGLAVRFHLL